MLAFKKLPKHIAIIMDGNRRWAKKNGLSLYKAYKKGLENLEYIIDVIYNDIKIPVLTLYAFSKDNWKRDEKEIAYIFYLLESFFNKKFQSMKKKKVQIIFSGKIELLNLKIQKILEKMIQETIHNESFILHIAMNYTGRNEIIEANKKIVSEYRKNKNLSIDSINEDLFQKYLFQPKIPDPDLLIRTSGEQRISNFFLWQIAYTELYFTEVLWPDFSKNDLYLALEDYQKRQRRFGGAY